MFTAYGVLPVLFILCKALSAQWVYTTLATTHDGRPCLTDCTDTCIVDWFGNRMGCLNKDEQYIAPKFRTALVKDKEHKYCLSNCGYFGYDYEWCVTSNKKDWDYCNSGDHHVSVYKHTCKENCAKRSETYYWCFVEGGSWQFCAPPREKQHRRWLPDRK